MLTKIQCSIVGHKINRRRAWHDSLDWRTNCVRCKVELVRDTEGWREFNAVIDPAPERLCKADAKKVADEILSSSMEMTR